MDIYSFLNLNYIHFVVELIICEIIFLLRKPRKEGFAVRLPLSLLLYFVFAFGWMTWFGSIRTESLMPSVFLYLGYAFLMTVPIWLCFDIQGLELLFAVAGGYAA